MEGKMSRPLRIEYLGAFYHVMSRGNEKQAIYRNRDDRKKFLDYLETATTRYAASIHCYCLMDNHYHLLIETPEGNLAQIMRHINGAYTSYFNTRHHRIGHLFQGRYHSILVDADAYFLPLSRYIHLNPVKEGLISDPAQYEWSSYRAYLDLQDAAKWLRTDFLLAILGHDRDVQSRYRNYVENDDKSFEELYAKSLHSMTILGRKEFVEEISDELLIKRSCSRDLPTVRKLRGRPEIHRVFKVVSNELKNDYRLAKKMSIYLCHHFSSCSLHDIGAYFGVGESAISESSNRFAATLYQDQRLAETVAGLLAELKL
jgi:putative transposase